MGFRGSLWNGVYIGILYIFFGILFGMREKWCGLGFVFIFGYGFVSLLIDEWFFFISIFFDI